MNESIIRIDEIEVHRDEHGRFSLNDLHRAAGGEERHRPSRWTENQQARDLAAHMESEAGIPALVSIHGGKAPGTYVARELVYAYAMWVSPAFHLKVIRTFDATATGRQQQAAILPATDQVSRHLELARLMPTLVVGLQPAMAVAVALDAIHRDTGLTTEPYRKLLPAASEPPGRLNATAVGKALGVSARKANAFLEAHGWQVRNERGEWELTPAGQEWGEAVPYSRGGHSGYQLLWKPEVVELLP